MDKKKVIFLLTWLFLYSTTAWSTSLCMTDNVVNFSNQVGFPIEVDSIGYESYDFSTVYFSKKEFDDEWKYESSEEGEYRYRYEVNAFSPNGSINFKYNFSGIHYSAKKTKFGSGEVQVINDCCIRDRTINIKDVTNGFQKEFKVGGLRCDNVFSKLKEEARSNGETIRIDYAEGFQCSENGKSTRHWEHIEEGHDGLEYTSKDTSYHGCSLATPSSESSLRWNYTKKNEESGLEKYISSVKNQTRYEFRVFCSSEDSSLKLSFIYPKQSKSFEKAIRESLESDKEVLLWLNVDKKHKISFASTWSLNLEKQELTAHLNVGSNIVTALKKGVRLVATVELPSEKFEKNLSFSLKGSSKSLNKLESKCQLK